MAIEKTGDNELLVVYDYGNWEETRYTYGRTLRLHTDFAI